MEAVPVQKRMESLRKSPSFSSPLRRRSITIRTAPSSNIFSENDDEAERIARRRVINTSTPLSSNSTSNKRHSLGLGILANISAPQMTETINQCIKLSTENKINIKNAFSLEMIDFMIYMIKKEDSNMLNLQVASTSLDVSTKIYGLRVDLVYTKMLKMIGGLDKQMDDNEQQDENEKDDIIEENAEGTNLEVQQKKGKRKKTQKILSTVEDLKGNVEIVKPMLMMIGEGDLQTSDMLYQAMLPKHANSGFYQHLYNDVLVDVAEEPENESDEQKNNSAKCTIPAIEDFRNLKICASYANFEFLNWSVDDKSKEDSSSECDEAENGFQFNLDASVEHDNEPASEPINYFDFERDNNDDDRMHICYMQANRGENIMNAQDITVPTAASSQIVMTSEYSFVQLSMNLHWAGPSHWKFRNLAKPPASAAIDDKIVGACKQAPYKKRKEIKVSYDEKKNEDIDAKCAQSQSSMLLAKTVKIKWDVESIVLPEDVHYDITRQNKLYLHKSVSVKLLDNSSKDNVTNTVDVFDGDRYDYNNPNDVSDYCPNVNNDDCNLSRDNDENECHFVDDINGLPSQGFTGDNLVAAPKLANKINIAYCLRAKKVDMRQLKKAIWHCLKATNIADVNDADEISEQVERTESTASSLIEVKQFSDIYKKLPKLLTKSNAEALSVPLSFISLLHLANEKELTLSSQPDMSDVIIEKR